MSIHARYDSTHTIFFLHSCINRTASSLPHLKHIANDKEVRKDPPFLSHSKQPNDPGEAKQRD